MSDEEYDADLAAEIVALAKDRAVSRVNQKQQAADREIGAPWTTIKSSWLEFEKSRQMIINAVTTGSRVIDQNTARILESTLKEMAPSIFREMFTFLRERLGEPSLSEGEQLLTPPPSTTFLAPTADMGMTLTPFGDPRQTPESQVSPASDAGELEESRESSGSAAKPPNRNRFVVTMTPHSFVSSVCLVTYSPFAS